MALYPQSAFINNIMNSLTAIGLFNSGAELLVGNYARVSITPSTHLQMTFDAFNYYISNKVQLSFVQASTDWGNFNQIGIFAGSNLWFLIDVSSRTVKANDQVFIDVGQLLLMIPKSIG
jgi:hypothetical protein